MESISPVHYRVRLEPDLQKFTFGGFVEMEMKASKTTGHVVLNILDIDIRKVELCQDGKSVECGFSFSEKEEVVRIDLPSKVYGSFVLQIYYRGEINDKMAGFYRSRFEQDGKDEYIAVTQFEESDARRAFPCMDHPSKKATFDVEMIVPQDMTALSNGDVIEDEELPGGLKRVVFERTPKMSTYLVFFGVGRFVIQRDQADPRVRVITLPGMEKHGEFGMDFGRKALQYCEEYYGIPYPLSKMDLIAIPDFAFGAMENWGAITFRENLLLHQEGITSKSGEQRICEVISHEIVHQWFGNLVTPSDWKYLWLNESFATLFGYGVVAFHYPEWDVWEQFINDMTSTAFNRDAMGETFAIEIPGGEHVVINTSTAPIIYNKGGSILRQVRGYIGENNFKAGLRSYLRSHEYDSAASWDLWDSLEGSSSQPIKRLMKSWIEQPGFPLVKVSREENTLTFKQDRFTYLPGSFDQKWIIPLTIQLYLNSGETKIITSLLEGEQETIDIDDRTQGYKVNDRQTGFYRVFYDDMANWSFLKEKVAGVSMSSEDRWGLQNDLYAFVQGGKITFSAFLDLLLSYKEEESFLPILNIASNLSHASLVLEDSFQSKISEFARPFFESVLDRIGYDPLPEEKSTTSILREAILWGASRFGSKTASEFALGKFEDMRHDISISPDLMRSVMQIGASLGATQSFEYLNKRFQTSGSEHDRMNILLSMGYFREEENIERVLGIILETVPPRNKFVPVMTLANNPVSWPLLWKWFQTHLRSIETFHPMIFERIVVSIIPSVGIENPVEVREFFQDYARKKDSLGGVIKMSLEKLEVNIRMRERNG
ncbi:M1 family metallopeptidase [Acidobacteriota bacterium]